MKTIIANSGGLDSTYALWKLLSETNDDVTVIYLNAEGLSSRLRMKYDIRMVISKPGQKERVLSIIDWMKNNVRACGFSEVVVDETFLRMGIEYPNSNQTVIAEWAIARINGGLADKLVISTEHENDGLRNGGTVDKRATGAEGARDRFVEFATRGELKFLLIDMNYHQAVALRELPADLLALTRSCDSPEPEPCGICFKCSKRKFFAEAIAQGNTDEDIRSYIALRSELPNGRWRSMKYWIAEDVPTCAMPIKDGSWEMPSWPQSVVKSDGAT